MPVRARAQHPQDTVDEEAIVLGGAADSSYRLTMSHAPNHLIRNTRNHRPNAMGILNVDWI